MEKRRMNLNNHNCTELGFPPIHICQAPGSRKWLWEKQRLSLLPIYWEHTESSTQLHTSPLRKFIYSFDVHKHNHCCMMGISNTRSTGFRTSLSASSMTGDNSKNFSVTVHPHEMIQREYLTHHNLHRCLSTDMFEVV